MINFEILENELALKAVAWDYDRGTFVSPSVQEFTWSREGLEAGVCEKGCIPCEPPPTPYRFWTSSHIPGDDCSCGLYATYRWGIVLRGYISSSQVSPVLLVEVGGKTILYDETVRVYQLTMKAAIKDWWVSYPQHARKSTPLLTAATYQAADYFNIPVLSMAEATTAMDLWNIKLNPTWEEWYVPESPAIKRMPKQSINELVETYFPEHEKEVTWESLLQSSST